MYEGIQSEMISTTRFEKSSDLSMAYLELEQVKSKQRKDSLYQNKGIQ